MYTCTSRHLYSCTIVEVYNCTPLHVYCTLVHEYYTFIHVQYRLQVQYVIPVPWPVPCPLSPSSGCPPGGGNSSAGASWNCPSLPATPCSITPLARGVPPNIHICPMPLPLAGGASKYSNVVNIRLRKVRATPCSL